MQKYQNKKLFVNFCLICPPCKRPPLLCGPHACAFIFGRKWNASVHRTWKAKFHEWIQLSNSFGNICCIKATFYCLSVKDGSLITYGEGVEDILISSLQHEKAVPCFNHTEKLIFIRHSSEYETSDSDRKVNRNFWPDAGTRDMMNSVAHYSSYHVYPHLAKNFGSPLSRYPTFHTLKGVGRK